MATRKIRLTMSGTLVEDQGPIIDIDFNDENLDVDLEITAVKDQATIVKEYTVEADAGKHNLVIDYKNDEGGVGDRNLFIERLEFSNDGSNYETLIFSEDTTTVPVLLMGWKRRPNPDYDPSQPKSESNFHSVLNPDYDPTQPVTDSFEEGYLAGRDPGSNAKLLYDLEIFPASIYDGGLHTFYITFS